MDLIPLCEPETRDLWFSTKRSEQKEAISICRSCRMIDNCLQTALEFRPEFGIWAGMTAQELEEMWTEM